MATEAALSRWQHRIDVAEQALLGDRQAWSELGNEIRGLTDDEQLLATPAAARSMSYFLVILRELGGEAQQHYAHATQVISDWVTTAQVPAEHACLVHNRLATTLAEGGNDLGALQALSIAAAAARTPWEKAITLAQRSVLKAQLKKWSDAWQDVQEAERLVPQADNDAAWLDVRLRIAAVKFRVERLSGFRDLTRMRALADELIEVCDRQIDRWGNDHPRALEALVIMASTQHAVGEKTLDRDSMERTTDVLEAVAQRSSARMGVYHPQSTMARIALEEAYQATKRVREPESPSPPRRPAPSVTRAFPGPHRFHEQFDTIQQSMPDVPLAMGPDDAAEFFYEKGVVLARDGEEARLVEDTVREYFTQAIDLTADHVRRDSPLTNRSGITRIRVGDPGHGDHRGDRAVTHALRALREYEGRAGSRLVSRNHVVSIAVGSRSGDEPVSAALAPAPNPAPTEATYDPDTAVNVLVVDNGLTRDYPLVPLFANVQGDLHGTETDADGNLLQYVGHGTFIAGILAAVAPNSNITVRNTLNDAGAILESDFGNKLFEAVERDGWPDIISLSAGTVNGHTDGLLGMEAFMRELLAHDTLLVAAAGDHASATPFWPAAYASLPDYTDAVLSVGALRADGEYGACFTNHGAWVNAYAPGERLTSTLIGFVTPVPYIYQHSSYAACRYGFNYACTCQFPRRTGALSMAGTSAAEKANHVNHVLFDGYAHWSGTSFATPVAAGLVASYMTATKERDPRATRRSILAANTAFAEVRGVHVPALRPTTWRPTPAIAAA